MSKVPSDIEIATAANMLPIAEVASRLEIPSSSLWQVGPTKAKLDRGFVESAAEREDGKLILVTAITPTPAGEGKTTTSIGLGDALCKLGKRASICLREPSLGPCFGIKGGAAGGGYSQVVPMEDINLHFTGDLHAIGAANNLLAAMIDNHINWGNKLGIDPRRISWRRAVDINDRALRKIVVSMGGLGNGYVREDGFDITVASEVMAIFCLAKNLEDLKTRLGNIVVARTSDQKPITARDLEADGSMAVLLKDAFQPNLVQTLENNPAFIHGGPFANIAHGCNSVIATKTALRLSDYVVTEAGFGADLGAQKFFDIKCRKSDLHPAAAVVVATVRALKMHGGVALADLGTPDPDAVTRGAANLERHLRNVGRYGVPTVVAINRFTSDTDAEIEAVRSVAAKVGAKAIPCTHWADGGAGATDLAKEVLELVDGKQASFELLYPNEMPIWEKIETIAKKIYGADGIEADGKVRKQIAALQDGGYGHLPVCIAKTQYSFSTDPTAKGAPSGHTIGVREIRLAGGAEFVVVLCGDVMTMPGLPRSPAANQISLDEGGNVVGLF